MVTIGEVRAALDNISVDLIPDVVINYAISDAEAEFEWYESDSVPTQLIDRAVKYKAAYLSYIGYLSKMERGLDVAPTPQMKSALDLLDKEVQNCLAQIKNLWASPSPLSTLGKTAALEDSL